MLERIISKAHAYTVNVPIARDENNEWIRQYDSFNGYFLDLIGLSINIAIGLATIFIIWGGVKYATSAGDETKAKDGKDYIVGAIVGLALLLLTRLLIPLLGIQ